MLFLSCNIDKMGCKIEKMGGNCKISFLLIVNEKLNAFQILFIQFIS